MGLTPYSWVNIQANDIDEEVYKYKENDEQEENCLHRDKVSKSNCLNEECANTIQGKHSFYDNRTDDHQGKLRAECG